MIQAKDGFIWTSRTPDILGFADKGSRDMNDASLEFDHIHIISADPEAAAAWYARVLGGVVADTNEVRGAPQIRVDFGGATIVIRGGRPGENPIPNADLRSFGDFASHDQWGVDHFGFRVAGDFKSYCDNVRRQGGAFSVEPHEFLPGLHVAYIAAPDGVTVELISMLS